MVTCGWWGGEMRYGVCCRPDQVAEFANLGFDFVEWSVAGNVGLASDEEFAGLSHLAESLSIRPECWNILLPGELKIVGPDADHAELRRYLTLVLGRVRALGGELVVFGSGRSRTYGDGFDAIRAKDQLDGAVRIIADEAGNAGVTIVLEPLRHQETNLINTVIEGAELVRRIDHPRFRLLADVYHLVENGEAFATLGEVGELLEHVHISSWTRFIPEGEQDALELAQFLEPIKATGYAGRLSFEAKWEDPATVGRGLEVLRTVWESV